MNLANCSSLLALWASPLKLKLEATERSRVIVFTVFLLLVAVAIRVHWATWLDPFTQQDAGAHLPALDSASKLHFKTDYNAPYYYLVVSLLSAPLSVLYHLQFISNRTFFTLATLWSGLILQASYMYGCFMLARHLRYSLSAQFLFVALCTFFPPIQRSLAMLRPENLILALTPYVCIYFLLTWRVLNDDIDFFKLPFVPPALCLSILIAAQKISGLFLLVGLALITLLKYPGSLFNRVLGLWRAAALICIALAVLIVLQRALTGHWYLDNIQYYKPDFQTPPHLSLFTTFDPVLAWYVPFRNTHKHSMLNILLIDMFGDYWRYGIDHHAAPDQDLSWRLFRARTGMIAASLFIACYLMGALALMRVVAGKQLDHLASERAPLSLLFLLGPCLLVLASFAGIHAGKFDIIKWEYITPFIPFMMLPLVGLYELSSLRLAASVPVTIVLWLLVSAGIAQSVRI